MLEESEYEALRIDPRNLAEQLQVEVIGLRRQREQLEEDNLRLRVTCTELHARFNSLVVEKIELESQLLAYRNGE